MAPTDAQIAAAKHAEMQAAKQRESIVIQMPAPPAGGTLYDRLAHEAGVRKLRRKIIREHKRAAKHARYRAVEQMRVRREIEQGCLRTLVGDG